jgi:hypothetical protein
MINQLVAALGQGLGLTSKEIADVVWLALQMQTPESALKGTEKAPSSTIEPAPRQSKSTASEASNLFSERDRTKDAQSSKSPRAELHMPDSSIDGQGGFESGLPLKVPDARSLREPLSLAKSLKPLLQKVTAGLSAELDEVATVERIADEGIWLPVLKPALEPWLDLALVVDESLSMHLWQQTIAELQRLLSHYGVFRDVRVWSLVTDDQDQIALRPRLGAANQRNAVHRPKELIDPSGRRLILIATDCVDAIWQNGSMLPALKLWAGSGPMAIMQMLPEWLWARTGLGFASAVKLNSLLAGIPNQQLNVRDLSSWDEVNLASGIRVPVVTLEPESFLAWSKMVSARGGAWSPGFVFEEGMNALNGTGQQTLLGELTPEQRVQEFRSTASPMARRLAGLLAAAPTINLPIVRIIQDRLLPQSRQVHVAEVFLGGLLKPLSGNQLNLIPDLVPFDFLNGVRSLILESLPTDDSVNVIGEVSQFVADRLGLSLDAFAALLKSPQQVLDKNLANQARPFALVTASILWALGSRYSEIASELELAHPPQISSTQTNKKIIQDYQVGGSLPPDSPTYIKRQADEDLYLALKRRLICYVISARQMGKSSLIWKTINRLEKEEIACVWLDLASISTSQITSEQWYAGLIQILAVDSKLIQNFDLTLWWNSQSHLSPVARLGNFIEEVFLARVTQPIVIFVDEFDSLLSLGFDCDDFLAFVHRCHNKRAVQPVYQRLTFSLIGVVHPTEIIQGGKRSSSSSFNIGSSIYIKGFSLAEAEPLASGLIEVTENPQRVLKEILKWTGGQPFLTQKICRLVKDSGEVIPPGHEDSFIEKITKERIIEDWERHDEPEHLRTIQARLLFLRENSSKKNQAILKIYKNILATGKVKIGRSQDVNQLLMAGVVIEDDGQLVIANRIYEKVFNLSWINQFIDEKVDEEKTEGIRLFLAYSNRDEALRDELAKHLSLLERQGVLSSWHDRQIAPGSEWAGQIDHYLEQAQIILLLVSADFLASDYCYGVELTKAMERHEAGKAVVIPVILRSADWQGTPFRQLQALPKNAQPVTAWVNRDEAFIDIARGICRVVEGLKSRAAERPTPAAKPQADTVSEALAQAVTVPPPQDLEIPEGQIPLESPFYVKRPPIEADCYRAIMQPSALIRIKAPRQMGKSSLMARILHHASKNGARTVSLSFQEADSDIFAELTGFLQWFCATIADALGLPDQLEQHWRGPLGSKQKCSKYLASYLLPTLSGPLTLGLDEVDLVFQYPKIAEDFFALLRAWHEKRNDPLWHNLRIIIACSKEVYVPLKINQSPFNVDLAKDLPEFTPSQVSELAARHGLTLGHDLTTLMTMLGGHPYLIRVALYHLATGRYTLPELLAIAPTEEGPYAEHLRRHLQNLEESPDLLAAMRTVLQSEESAKVGSKAAFRLQSMGVVKIHRNAVEPFCDLYRIAFRERLLR